MFECFKNKIDHIELVGDPHIQTNSVLPYDNKETVEYKRKNPFKTTRPSILKIYLVNKELKKIIAPSNLDYDGATIPFNIGKSDMRLLIGSLFHDIVCKHKSILDYDRELASQTFRETIIACSMPKLQAYIMYWIMNIYQIIFRDWRKPKNYDNKQCRRK